MASFPGRNGRRRRVLNEEVLSASSSHLALRAAPRGETGGPRYSDAASAENNPQITDFVPRRLRTIAILLLIGLLSTIMIAALQQFGPSVLGSAGVSDRGLFDAADAGFTAWISAVVLFAVSATCLLIHSIRRHRIDDFRGRYRVWRWAALAAILASANSVAGIHALAADVLGNIVHWTALRGGAIWWIFFAGLPMAYLSIRVLVDVFECRAAAVLVVSSIAAYAAAVAAYIGCFASLDATIEPLVTRAAMLMGHWALFAAMVAYARHVVLDAQGLIAHRGESTKAKTSGKAQKSTTAAEKQSIAGKAEAASPAKLQVFGSDATRERPLARFVPAKTPASTNDWVDGSRRERDRYEELDRDDTDDDTSDGDHKLSKAERKQMRKLKARNRAA